MKEEDPTRVNQKVITEFMLFYKIKHQALLFLLILVLQFKKQLDFQKIHFLGCLCFCMNNKKKMIQILRQSEVSSHIRYKNILQLLSS